MDNENIVTNEIVADPAVKNEIVKRRAAEAALRKEDCKMLARLKDILGENIRLHGILADINARIADINRKLKTPKPKIKKGLLFFGILFLTVAIVAFLVPAASQNVSSLSVIFLAIGLAFLIPAIVIKIVAVKRWKAYLADLRIQLAQAEAEAAAAQNAIDEYWANEAKPYILTLIPDRVPRSHVLNYRAISDMLWLMENLRADTVKEATNLYEELIFRSSMRSISAKVDDIARDTRRSALANEEAARAAKSTAASAAAMSASMASIAASEASIAHSEARRAAASESAARSISDLTYNY